MDQIIAANYHRNSNLGFAENFKRDKIGEEILKTNDGIGSCFSVCSLGFITLQ